MAWNAPELPSGIDTFQAKQQPRPEPVDELSRFVLNRITFEEDQPRVDGVPDLHYKPGGAAAHRYAGYVRRDMVAFRRIVAEYVAASAALDAAVDEDEHNEQGARMLGLRIAVASIAMLFAEHPDFRGEWRLE